MLLLGTAVFAAAPSATAAEPATSGTGTSAVAALPATGPLAMAPDVTWCRNSSVSYEERLDSGCFGGRTASAVYLPSERWSDAASSLHSRKIGGITNMVTDLSTTLQRDATFPTYISFGNTLWAWTTSWVSGAVRMDFMYSLGASVDGIVAGVGSALLASPLIAAIIVVALCVVLWRAMRGRGNPVAYLARAMLTVGVLAAMVFGASSSTTTEAGAYQAGTLSPGWLAQTANSVISSLASAPAAALTANVTSVPGAADSSVSGALSCQAYVARLNEQYVTSAGGASQLASKMESSVPMLLSRMWEQTGLQAWKVAQFGGGNEYGEWSYCRLLEERAGISAAQQAAFTLNAGGVVPATNPDAAPWGTGSDNDAEDRNLIAWAACRLDESGTWTVDSGWSGVSEKSITADDCSKWWNDDYFTGSGENTAGIISQGGSNFDWGGKPSETINRTGSQPEVRNYLLSLHGAGSSAGGNLVLVASYVISALITLVVFGLLSLGILFFKLSMVVMTFSVVFTLVRDLLPSEGPSATGKLLRSYVGVAFGVFGIGLVLALVTMLTALVVSGASAQFGGGSVATMMWTGVAPLVSLWALHWVFTKVLKMPSPLSVTGASAWGKAAAGGAVGGALGAGTAEMLARRGGHVARSGARMAGQTLTNRMRSNRGEGPGRGGRPSRAGRSRGTELAAVGAAGAAGAAVGAATDGGAGQRPPSRPGRGARGAEGAGRRQPSPQRAARVEKTAENADASVAERRKRRRAVRDARREAADRAGISMGEYRAQRAIGWAASKEARARLAARARKNAAASRRGYGGGVAGNVVEGVQQRVAEARAAFAAAPVRSSLRVVKGAAKVAGIGAAVVLTGGAALPVAAALSARKQITATRRAQRRAVENHERRLEEASQAKQLEEAAAQQRDAESAQAGAAAAGPQPTQGPAPQSAGAPAPRRAGRPRVATARPRPRRAAAARVAGGRRSGPGAQW
ncbi:hypothetical protein CHO01_31580 [Cellulomonas hominis]|uniref:Uncharacterized protein n=1 Tax=Cellulomonas hominis TaxID=156981 RepID=A0A511FFT3_9CELL|nr:hypothetical protein CHO01_31580 [Cellulomonas hominis]